MVALWWFLGIVAVVFGLWFGLLARISGRERRPR